MEHDSFENDIDVLEISQEDESYNYTKRDSCICCGFPRRTICRMVTIATILIIVLVSTSSRRHRHHHRHHHHQDAMPSSSNQTTTTTITNEEEDEDLSTPPTKSPTMKPTTASPTPKKKQKKSKKNHGLDCRSDRLAHNDPLPQNTYICSREGANFYFGLDENANLIYRSLDPTVPNTKWKGNYTLFQQPSTTPTTNANNTTTHQWNFVMLVNATFVVKNGEEDDDSNGVQWQADNIHNDIEYNGYCLTDYPCPYLHLHRDGILVLNWIDGISGQWLSSNIRKLYNF